jgi:hypothetical protein
VSLDPSVGNWSFPYCSHYFIRNGAMLWAGDMSEAAIKRGRVHADEQRKSYYEDRSGSVSVQPEPIEQNAPEVEGIWVRLKRWFNGINHP